MAASANCARCSAPSPPPARTLSRRCRRVAPVCPRPRRRRTSSPRQPSTGTPSLRRHRTRGQPPRATPPRPTPTIAEADARGYQVVIAAGQQAGKTVLLHDGLTIGRNPRLAFLVLLDPEVSSLHARIARDGGPPILIDANSTNGTFVNGERITNRPLQAGDEIAIGGVRLRVQVTN